MRTTFAILLLLLVAGCANRQPTVAEMRVQSKALPSTATAMTTGTPGALAPAPFCLHVRYANEFKFVYTQNDAEAWVTDGSCDVSGPRRAVSELVLRWRYLHDSTGTKSCSGAEACSISEPNPGEGKRIACVSATARDRGFEAGLSTDSYACAK